MSHKKEAAMVLWIWLKLRLDARASIEPASRDGRLEDASR